MEKEFHYVENKYGKDFIKLYENSPYENKKNKCKVCAAPAKNIFCSRKCSAAFNNKGVQRNKPKERKCKKCEDCYVNTSQHKSKNYCSICLEAYKQETSFEYIKNKTLGELKEKLTVKGKHQSWKSSEVRNFNRSWNKNLTKNGCQNCDYKLHVELCHIKAISDFPDSATLGEVNSPDNILVLCRNCHWEFDNKKLLLEHIPERSA